MKRQLLCTLGKEGWYSLDEKGLSWAETMLSLLIVFMLFGTLLPTMQKMHQTLDDKHLQAAAYETLHEAAKMMKIYGSASGKRSVNNVDYLWVYSTDLCVHYENNRAEPKIICVE